ncbi:MULTISPECIES: hypothetical protein [Sphingobium]|jgi:hypothetical protein|uniref:Uncharacterized protein n=1 Tax=Sphingobium yanoikuyae TaxID=13690 RepID=A0A0J9D470_SPHYA|nr:MULTISPECIES: hypothetical protein [Sphingobium]ATP20188.1 hypothetical protein BV87_18510 [Sphingobium yanoikuyae]KMW32168.1 hypothetical protein BV87_17800 [Sphingobium yanoikuyae]RSU75210.1 hypothetical protein BRX37_11585 [Sphingomonas sp. S-NIH.Pt3_0716]TKV40774.1 hypothetical protein A0U87_05920 [Sphingobium sp. MP9-4]
MKMIAASLISSALLLGVSLTPFADAQAPQTAQLLEGKDHPILLARMTVTATPLPPVSLPTSTD